MTESISIAGTVPLLHWGVIRARGADATNFLQAQLTNDVATLATTEARLAGYCSAKGRLLASFVIWRHSPDEVLLACSTDLLAATMKRMSMFILRAKCELSDASGEIRIHGVVGENVEEAPWSRTDHHGYTTIRLPDADGHSRMLWLTTSAGAEPKLGPIELDVWRWLEVRSGVPMIVAATADQFVPQMVNFEALGGIDFKKGCYPGQEVVARSQYRGTIKRRMFLFGTAAEAVAGQEVFHSLDPNQPCGMVVNAAPRPGGGSGLLVQTKLSAITEGSVHLGLPGGALLERQALPYRLPVDAA
jgi:folate-binding protein YgfZ